MIFTKALMKDFTAHPVNLSGQRRSLWTVNAPIAAERVKPAKEEAYFFKMSKYADRLIAHINSHPEFIQPVSGKTK